MDKLGNHHLETFQYKIDGGLQKLLQNSVGFTGDCKLIELAIVVLSRQIHKFEYIFIIRLHCLIIVFSPYRQLFGGFNFSTICFMSSGL